MADDNKLSGLVYLDEMEINLTYCVLIVYHLRKEGRTSSMREEYAIDAIRFTIYKGLSVLFFCCSVDSSIQQVTDRIQ